MGFASLSLPLSQTDCKSQPQEKRHIVTLSFDDGFKKSSLKTAEIYKKYGLSVCINVIAAAHLKKFELPAEYHQWLVGDFELWNELQQQARS